MSSQEQQEQEITVKIKVHSTPVTDEDNSSSCSSNSKNNIESKLDKLLNNTEQIEHRCNKDTCLDAIFLKTLQQCSIAPNYSNMFGMRRTSSGDWLKLSSTLEQLNADDKEKLLKVELRVRFAFKSECSKNGRTQYCHRYYTHDNSSKCVMNETVIRYYFYQRRRDFIEGEFLSGADINDTKEISPQLGVAVLDMVRIAREMEWDLPRVQRRVKFKWLLPLNIRKAIKSMGFVFKKKVRLQFDHYIKHFKHIFEDYLDGDRFNVSFVYSKYLRNLELVPGCDHCEKYDFYRGDVSNDRLKLMVNGDIGVVQVNEEKNEKRKEFDFCDLADMALIKHKKTNQQTEYCVSLSLLKGGIVQFCFMDEENANSLATCIDGYYRLLVDTHYYLCADLTPPHVIDLLKLSCHAPIAFNFAEDILKSQSLVRVGDCLLRQSLVNFNEFFINAVMLTEPKILVKNYKLNRNDGGMLGIYGDPNSYEYADLDSLLKSCRNGVHDPLPFQLQHIIPPQVKQRTNLIVRRCGDDQSDQNGKRKHQNISSILLCIRNYNIMSYLGRGRFTEVKLYKSNLENDKLVVIKETMYKEHVVPSNQANVDFCLKQCVDDSFERSRNLLSKVDTNHIVKFIGTIKNMVVLQHVAMGSITTFLRIRGQKALVDFNEPWFTTVMWQLTHACTYLEEKNLAHGNIHGKNVLLMKAYPQPHVKLSDSGVTICSRTDQLQGLRYKENKYEPCLHPPWLAYEFCAVTGKPQVSVSNVTYPTTTGDRWSYATTVYEICHLGKYIKWSDSAHNFNADMTRKYTTANIIQPSNLFADVKYAELHELLRQCWNVYPPKRPPFRMILRELRRIITESDYAFEVDEQLSEKQIAELEQPKLNLDTFYEDNLNFRRQLGKGHFGHVDLFEYMQGHNTIMVAVKSLKDPTQWSGNEIETMRSLDHEFIVRLKGISSPSEMIVLEYLPEGNLHEWVIKQRNSHNRNPILNPVRNLRVEFLKFSEQIAEGMVYLQDAKILHRDLALRNILLAKDEHTNSLHIKISDFGLSRLLPEHEEYYKGNPDEFPALWYAPECLNIQKKVYKMESDIWSYGVLLWEMFSYCARPSYPDPEVKNVEFKDLYKFYNKLREGLRLSKPMDCPEHVYELMKQCWNFEPEKRVSFRNLQLKFADLR